jgi:dTMP kinase
MGNGLFITFEGSEGCGKSTQIQRLHAHLEAAGAHTMVVREPGGTAAGEEIRQLVLQHRTDDTPIAPECELLLFAASRAQLVREKIVPALMSGVHVIADRFYDSTTVYQGFGRGLDLSAIRQINHFAVGGSHPDMTFLLDLDPAEGHARAMQRSHGRLDRMESESMEFFEKVRAGYLRLAREEAPRFTVLDGSLPRERLEAEIWSAVQARLASR